MKLVSCPHVFATATVNVIAMSIELFLSKSPQKSPYLHASGEIDPKEDPLSMMPPLPRLELTVVAILPTG